MARSGATNRPQAVYTKNGKLIYEGDICNMSEESDDYRQIHFLDGGFGWYAFGAEGAANWFVSFSGHNYLPEVMGRIEVVGNIHENPDLLKD